MNALSALALTLLVLIVLLVVALVIAWGVHIKRNGIKAEFPFVDPEPSAWARFKRWVGGLRK